MTSIPRLASVLAAATLVAVGLTACTGTASEPTPTATATAAASATPPAPLAACAGVQVIVDATALRLADDPSRATCIETPTAIGAADALAAAGITTEGTDEYGDQVVCRVDGVPASDLAIPNPDGGEYVETCASMPAAFAYWALWVKPAGGEWAYAQEGLSTLQVQPGESLELLFTLDGEPAAPAS